MPPPGDDRDQPRRAPPAGVEQNHEHSCQRGPVRQVFARSFLERVISSYRMLFFPGDSVFFSATVLSRAVYFPFSFCTVLSQLFIFTPYCKFTNSHHMRK